MNASKKKWALRAVLLLLIALLAVPLSASAASKIKLNKTKITINKGKSYRLKVSGTKRKVKWSSSKRSVAVVNSSGKVTAKKKGTAVITAKVGSKRYRCKVTVKQPVTSVKLNAKSKTLTKGSSCTLKATVRPTNANNRAVTWTSSNKKVATVTSKGKVKAVGKGTAVITAKAKDGSKKYAKCKITVKAKKTSSSSKTLLTLNKTKLTLQKGKTATLKATAPDGVRVTWGSSKPGVVSVSSTGKLTAKAAGSAVIAARRVDGKKTLFCTVTVQAKQSSTAAKPGSGTANAQKFLNILQKYSNQVKADREAGIKWGYSNSSSQAKSTWSAAYSASRSKGVTYCNCALLPRWALREMGVINSANFWGLAGGGIQFRSNVEEQLRKYCDIIRVYKTPNQLLAEGNLRPGDICTWVEYQHTNVYAGNGLWYDSGRGVNYDSSEGAFTSFGPSAAINMSGTTVGYIIRFR